MQQLNRKLGQLFGGNVVTSPAPTTGQWQQTRQQQQPQQQQQQGSSSSSKQDLVGLLQQLALFAGGEKPSSELVSTCAQQASKLLEEMEGELPFADWETATEDSGQQDAGAQERGDGAGMQQQSDAAPFGTAAAAAAAAGVGKPGSSQPFAPARQAGKSDRPGSSSGAAKAAAGTPPRQQMPGSQQDGNAPLSGQHMTPSGQQYSRQQLRERNASTTSPGGHLTAIFSMQPDGLHRPQQQQQQQQEDSIAAAAYGGDELVQQLQALTAQAEALRNAHQAAAADLEDLQDMLQSSLPALPQQQTRLEQQLQQLSQEVQDLVSQLQDNKLQQLELRAQQRQQQLQQPASYAAAQRHVPAAATGGGQDTAGEGLLRRMGPTVDPVNAIFHPYTAGRGISLSAFEPLLPALQQTGGSVPAAAVVEALSKLREEVRSVAAGQLGAAAAANPSSRPGSSKQAAAAAVAAAGHGSQGEAATAQAAGAGSPQKQSTGSSSSNKEFAFPNFGKKTVQQAATWYHDTPLADRVTAREGGDCKGWTPAQMQEQKKHDWRGGSRGPRFQRWAEWVQLMQYLAARQLELIKERDAVVSLMAAAAVLDQERGENSLTQFYKGTVAPWAKQQEAERQGAVEGGEEEMEGDGEAVATQ
jgi:ribosomal protein L29